MVAGFAEKKEFVGCRGLIGTDELRGQLILSKCFGVQTNSMSRSRLVTGSRQVFTKVNADRDIDWCPRAHLSATVASSRGVTKVGVQLLQKDCRNTIAETVEYDCIPIFSGSCLSSG